MVTKLYDYCGCIYHAIFARMLAGTIRLLLLEVVNMSPATHKIQLVEFSRDQAQTRESHVIVETPVSLTVNGQAWLTFMCTPVDLESLAVGFLYNEGLIDKREEVVDVRVCASGDNVDVWLAHPLEKPSEWRRTTGCTGGVTSVGDDNTAPLRSYDHHCYTTTDIYALLSQLIDAQEIYRLSGGVHTSILSDGEHRLVTAEDIGRHNTLDKIAGFCFLHQLYPQQRVLLTTGRISSEMLQKAARLEVALLISRTSPSALSIQLAQGAGITLIGYARPNRFIVYTHPERITGSKDYTGYAIPTSTNRNEVGP
jgi:FdhD protein